MQIAHQQIQAIRASLVAAMEQLEGLTMVMEAAAAEKAAPEEPDQEEVEQPDPREQAIAARPTFGRAKVPAAQSGDTHNGK